MSKLILVGRIAGAFGVRGEIRISTYTEEPMALVRFKRLLREDGSPALTITSGRPAKDGVVVRCPDINDKDAADALRGVRLYVTRDALPRLKDEDEFYLADLIGLEAVAVDGQTLGAIAAVHDYGAGVSLEIGARMVPFTRACVPAVDIAARRVTVALPDEVEVAPAQLEARA